MVPGVSKNQYRFYHVTCHNAGCLSFLFCLLAAAVVSQAWVFVGCPILLLPLFLRQGHCSPGCPLTSDPPVVVACVFYHTQPGRFSLEGYTL